MNKRDSKELGKYEMYFVASVIAMVALYFLAGPWFGLPSHSYVPVCVHAGYHIVLTYKNAVNFT